MDKKKNKKEEYVITPKGIALLALIKAGAFANMTNSQFDMFWEDFEASMKQCGYIKGV